MIPSYYDAPDRQERSISMRGDDPRHESMFSYITPETACARRSPAAADSPHDRRGVGPAVATVRSPVFDDGPALDPAGAVAARVAAADSVQHPQRAAADGGARLQRALSLVRRPEHGRPGVGRHDLYEESRSAARRAISPTPSSRRCSRRSKPTGLVSDEHFTVDGTLLEAWASHKSFRPKDSAPAAA